MIRGIVALYEKLKICVFCGMWNQISFEILRNSAGSNKLLTEYAEYHRKIRRSRNLKFENR
jgi:hypothetical protein